MKTVAEYAAEIRAERSILATHQAVWTATVAAERARGAKGTTRPMKSACEATRRQAAKVAVLERALVEAALEAVK